VALVTLEEVKGFLQGSAGDEDDALLTSLIGAVTRSFANHTHREFEPTADETRTFAHGGGTYLNLSPFDLRSVVELRTGTEGSNPSLVAVSDFHLRPLPNRDGVFQWIKLAANPGECEVTIKGDWGFAAIPEDIKNLAKTQIALWMRRDIQAYERTFNIDGGFFERPEALASSVRGGLSDYRRLVLP
jgi:hypothetical protein